MRFRVRVADRKTGEESAIELTAPTVQQARKAANDADFLIANIEPLAGDTVAATGRAPSSPALRRQRRKPYQRDQSLGMGGIFGAVFGGILGYWLGGILGILVGAFAAAIAGVGVAAALTPGGKLSVIGRIATGSVSLLFSAGIFFGFCMFPLNCMHNALRSDVEIETDRLIAEEYMDPEAAESKATFNMSMRNYESERAAREALKYSQRMDEYREQARKTLRAQGKDPDSLKGSIAHNDEIEARAKAIQKIDEAANPELRK